MDAEHENLPNGFAVTFIDEARKQRIRYVADLQDKEIAKGLENQGWMHWLPMTEDAVFEDGDFFLVSLPSLTGNFNINIASYQTGKHYPIRTPNGTYRRESITHYARITEPK